jgi:acyl-lipid omega-6 desaturase (Delta-12 desaturase)
MSALTQEQSEPMRPGPSAVPAGGREWMQKLAGYRQASTGRAIFELATTIVPFVLAWVTMVLAVQSGLWWLHLLLVIPTAGLLVRLFMIQHDCGHGSFFPARSWNDLTGRLIGVLTLTPYDHWRHSHAIHHASSGNLDRRGIGDIDTLTVDEYRALSQFGRLKYRLYRHPAIMFGIGPAYLFLLQNRLPLGFMRRGRQPWISTMGTNLGVAVAVAAMMWAVGVGPFLMVHLPVVLLAASAGVWLFYVQHQFEETHWVGEDTWNVHEAALHGSSHYDLPPILRWFTGNIGMHHVHHLSSRIPYYRLPQVLRDHPELHDLGRLTIGESLRCVRLALWDQSSRRLVSFADLPALRQAASPA